MRALPDATKAEAAAAAVRDMPLDVQYALTERMTPDQAVTNEIWRWIVRSFAIALAVGSLGLVAAVLVSFWRTIDTAVLLTLPTLLVAVAGILAGFVSGRASTLRTRVDRTGVLPEPADPGVSRSDAPHEASAMRTPSLPRVYQTRIDPSTKDAGDGVTMLTIPLTPVERGLLEEGVRTERLVWGALRDLELSNQRDDYRTLRLGESLADNRTLLIAELMVVTSSQERPTPARERFIQQVAYEPVILLDRSPVSGVSLASLVAGAGVGATDTTLAVLEKSGSQPLLLLYVPAGMILVGAAAGIARALNEGLYRRLLARLSGEAPVSLPDSETEQQPE